jgi:hypothetical protein
MVHRLGLATRVIAISLAAVAGLTACGDDDEALSEDEFVEQGNAICDEGAERTDAIFEELGDDPTDEQFAAAVEETADDIEGQISDLRDLEAPGAIADGVDAALDQAEDDLEEFRAQGAAGQEAATGNPFVESNPLLTDVGLTSCAAE